MQGEQVSSLVRELRAHMPFMCVAKTLNTKKKKYDRIEKNNVILKKKNKKKNLSRMYRELIKSISKGC